MTEPLLEVENLTVEFAQRRSCVHAVNDVSFRVDRGECLGVVGESGSGKSVTLLALLGLLPTPPARIVQGQARFNGQDLFSLSPRDLRRVRGGQIGMIFQDPMTSLNPVFTIGQQIREMLEVHKGLGRDQARKRGIDLLERVGIPSPTRRFDEYPHQLSGGMRQRAMIAMALSCGPQLLIADEPTTALDVTIQAQILALLKDLQQDLGMALILVTHDLGVVAGIADRLQVMYAGRIVESGTVGEVFGATSHPYTEGLRASLPRVDRGRDGRLTPIPGSPPDMELLADGCSFAPRCSSVKDLCRQEQPELVALGSTHSSACLRVRREQSIPQTGDRA